MQGRVRTALIAVSLAALAAVSAAGVYEILVRSFQGLRVANFTSVSPWGVWLSLYIYFIGLSAGSFLISSLVYVFGVKQFKPAGRMALIQALGCLLVGLTLIGIDLGRPERNYRVFSNWNYTSVMAWEILFYVAYMTVLAVEIWIIMRPDIEKLAGRTKWRILSLLYRSVAFYTPGTEGTQRPDPEKSKLIRVLAIIGIPLALGVHGGTGLIFAVLKARPYWYTGLFPIIFIVSALVSGGALLTVLTTLFLRIEKEEKLKLVRGLATLTGFILIGDLAILAIECFVALYGNVPDHSGPYMLILTGPFWWVFWIIQVLLGSLVPLFVILGPGKRSVKALGAACALIVIGIVGVRLNIVIPPLQTSWAGGLPLQFHESVSSFGYFPSWNEWVTTLGLLSFGVWGLLAAWKLLPLQHLPEKEENT